jgi:predicted nucleotidyltransferase component of viral defense system
MESISALSELPNKELFEQVATELSIASSMVEKDWFVVQVLSFLSSLQIPGFTIVFSGGTALSKAHGLTQRFSEDIDFLIVTPEHLSKSISKNSLRTALSKFKNELIEALRRAGFQVSDLKAKDYNQYFTANIKYETQFDRNNALRQDIKLEVTVLSPQIEISYKPIHSFLAKLKKEPPEVKQIACISPIETAADKLSALVWRIPNRIRRAQDDERSLVRHLHDLAILEKIAGKDALFADLVLNSLQKDNNRAKNIPDFTNLTNQGKFKLMFDTFANDTEYLKEYDLFVKGLSYAPTGTAPDFEMAIEAVKRLAQIVLSAES